MKRTVIFIGFMIVIFTAGWLMSGNKRPEKAKKAIPQRTFDIEDSINNGIIYSHTNAVWLKIDNGKIVAVCIRKDKIKRIYRRIGKEYLEVKLK